MTVERFLFDERGFIRKGVEIENMRRKKDRKPKIIIKTRNGGYTKIYANGKWQRKVTDIDLHGHVGDNGITIECEYTKLKCNKNGFPVVENNELVREKHTVRI